MLPILRRYCDDGCSNQEELTLTDLSLVSNLLIFAVLAAGIWLAGTYLTHLADILSDRLNFSKSATGLLFLALATSLPEVATTVTAAVEQHTELLLNNLFGGIVVQTTMLAVADFWVRGSITNYPRGAHHLLESVVLMLLLQILLAVILVGEPWGFGHVGIGSLVLGLCYILVVLLLRSSYGGPQWVPIEMPDQIEGSKWVAPSSQLSHLPTQRLLALAAGACVVILLFGSAIVLVSELLARQTGLGAGFVGASLLAAATSLPELSTTIAAVRLGAYTLAISNILGSNLIMIALVAPADLLTMNGPILRDVDGSIGLTVIAALLVTTVLCAGLIIRRKPEFLRFGSDSWIIMFVWMTTVLLLLG